ncbi:hypothetical protein SKAU_G00342420 [Synaphobranchus kaupii]|uniref:Uncharacterized protein n=1 Tax=Synaphobranchus kaupii TaxID=118154 RepID=A0A9Q1EN94_SYNKA|nr:hypothetical protein SKAU_G00342420 [Synaphobranchus kaupii]
MANEIYSYKAYSSLRELVRSAEALLTKHPCLRENGSKSGYDGWTNSLRFKMGNLRTKLSKAGIKDVAVNAGKRSRSNPEVAPSRANVKRPRRGEVNFLPNLPQGHTEESLGAQRLEMVEKSKKKDRDMIMINRYMQSTFALRRDETVKFEPPIAEFKERWPALFAEAQEMDNISAARTAALAGLPLYLREDSSEVFRICKEDELEIFHGGTVALVSVVDEDEDERLAAGVTVRLLYVSIILEDQVVMSVRSWPDALVVLYGLIYALHLSYPKTLKCFFEFIQLLLINLEDGSKQLPPKPQSLKNALE